MAWVNNDDVIRLLVKIGVMDAAGGIKRTAIAAKAANYAIQSAVDASGTLFTNRGAVASIAFTLPAPVAALAGVFYDFVGVVAAVNLQVAAPAGKIIAFNNLAATSVTALTAGGLIGAKMRATCDGFAWIIEGSQVGVTYTVA